MDNYEIMLRYGRIPYGRGADGIATIDCVSLVNRYFREFVGIDMPESPWRWRRVLRPLREDETIDKNDVLFLMGENRARLADHAAIALSPTDMIHAVRACNGVVCERIDRYRHAILGTWRLKKHEN